MAALRQLRKEKRRRFSAISAAMLEDLERAKGFEPSTPTLAKYFGHFSQTFPSTIIYAKSDIYDVPLYDCLRP
jgi:hypothetical protein